ncbi:protein-tyrosine phosphatase-like protein [Chytridium lagenaria]|nr:protein-tyrosine phosphatase-like protein [Chytridium lagenaria]
MLRWDYHLRCFKRQAQRVISASTPALPTVPLTPENEMKKTKAAYGSVDNLYYARKDNLQGQAGIVRVTGVSPTTPAIDIDFLVGLAGSSNHKQNSDGGVTHYSVIEHPSLTVRFLVTDCPSDGNLLGDYLPLFQEQNVKVLFRLCDPAVYNPNPLIQAGILVKDDLAFEDGSVPSPELVESYRSFMSDFAASSAGSSVAVHCVSGIGRAPILAAIALIDAGLDRYDVVDLIRAKRRGAFNKRQLEWILDAKRLQERLFGPLILFHHGGGHTSLTWYLVANQLAKEMECTILMYDCRGHGETHTSDDEDFSLTTLANDLAAVVKVVGETSSEVVLVGIEAALKTGLKNVIGVVMVDVVEVCLNQLKVKHIRNSKIAPLLIPPQLQKVGEKYVWRTDLAKTEPFWNEWFTNLSEKFLSVKAGRLLVLADKALTIAQMQGKFQMVVYSECGHSVHEEEPEKFAKLLKEFYARNQRNVVIKRFPIPAKK